MATPLKIAAGSVMQFQPGDAVPVNLGGTGANDFRAALAGLGGVSLAPNGGQIVLPSVDVCPFSVQGFSSTSAALLQRWFKGGISAMLVAYVTADGVIAASGGFSGDGSQLTNLNAGNLASGAVPAARLPASGVAAGSYANATVTVDQYGRVTAAANGTGGVTVPLTLQLAAASGNLVSLIDQSGVYSADFSKAGSQFALKNDVNVVVAPNNSVTCSGSAWGTCAVGALGLSAFPTTGSVSFWIKTPATVTATRYLFTTRPSNTDSIRCYTTSATNLQFVLNSAGSGVNVTVAANTLYHIVLTWRPGAFWNAYRNGVNVGGTTAQTPVTMGNLTIGGYGDNSNTTCWSGQVDDVRFYSVELSAAQVAAMYNAGAGGESLQMTGLYGVWQFNEGAGTQTSDVSGNGNTGTISGTGMTWVSGGIPASTPTTSPSTATIVQSGDGVASNEVGVHWFGDPAGGTRFQGQSVKVYTNGLLRTVVTQAGLWGINDLSPGAWMSIQGDGTIPTLVVKHTGSQKNALEVRSDGTIVFAVGPTGVFTADGSGLTNLNATNLASGTVPTARLGSNTASQYTFLSGASTWLKPLGSGLAQGRLTLQTNVPVSAADVQVAGGGTLYYTPYAGNKIALYNGTDWDVLTISQLSLTTGTTNTCYDVFAYASGGTVYLEHAAWTSYTARATALAYQDGVLVKSGTPSRRYLGTYAVAAGYVADSNQQRLVWNYYNRVARRLWFSNPASGSYTQGVSATWRPQNNSAGSFVSLVLGVNEEPTHLKLNGFCQPDTAYAVPSVGLSMDACDGTNGWVGGLVSHIQVPYANAQVSPHASAEHATPVGFHAYYWMERYDGSGSCLWYGSGGSLWQAGIEGFVRG